MDINSIINTFRYLIIVLNGSKLFRIDENFERKNSQ